MNEYAPFEALYMIYFNAGYTFRDSAELAYTACENYPHIFDSLVNWDE